MAYPSSKSIKIVIAEDSPTQAQQLQWLLESAGYEVRLAKNGKQAFQMIQQQQPDLLITDVVMPEMDGYQLSEVVRENFGHDIAVMLVTSLRSAKDVLKGLKVGADNFLTKPYKEKYLLDQVNYLLSNRGLRGQRKMQLSIEVEFDGELHTITADRQQILDLLISTYQEAVNINQELLISTSKLKTKVKLQNIQLKLANTLQKCTTVAELKNTVCQTLLPLKELTSIWFSSQNDAGMMQVEAGHPPSSLVAQQVCQCYVSCSGKKYTAQPQWCELSTTMDSPQLHLCIPIDIDDKLSFALNLMLAPDYGTFEDIRDSINTSAQMIETNLQRVLLQSRLEGLVAHRTEALEHSEKRFRAIVNSDLFGVVTLSATGKITFQNSTAVELLQIPQESDVLFQSLVIPDETSPSLNLPLDKRLLDRPYAFYIRRLDGEKIPILIKFSYLEQEEQTLLGAFVDMTDLKQAEMKLENIHRLESITSLSGGVAHDFNNLLSVILGNTEVLLDKSANQVAKDNASETIQQAAQSGAELTRQLLAFARRQPLALEAVDVAQVTNGLKQFLNRLIASNIEIDISNEDEIWPILTDYSQFERVLLNLAINARDAMVNGGTLSINSTNCRNVQLKETLTDQPIEGDFVRVEIKDSGHGIPEAILDKIFEPFFTTKKEGQGTGLGLAMVYGFIKQCSGYLQLESNPGATCFTLFFPRYESAKPNIIVTESQLGKQTLILLVEDNKELQAVMVRHIRSLDYQVEVVENVHVAIEILQQRSQEFSAVLTDFKLPGSLSGLDLVKKMVESWPDLPVALVTGSVFDVDNKTRSELNNLRILKKPFRREQLAQTITDMLSTAYKNKK
jgi:two-component system, cell cycle sensor histidine kinase and response regulator CckA